MHTDPAPTARFRPDGDPILRRVTGGLLLLAGACAGAAAVLLLPPGPAGRGLGALRAAPAGGASGATAGTVPATGRGADRTAGAPPAAPGPSGAGSAAGSAAPGVGNPAAGDGYSAIAKNVMPAVVNISSVHVIQTYERYSPFAADPFFQQFFGGGLYDYVVPRERREMSLGSGVIVDERGTILTNNHVVEQATEVRVALSDGRELPAKILGVDPRTDLAALRVEAANLPHAALGNSDALQVGDIVLAFGNPFGLGGTVTMGIVSAIGRGNLGLADYEDFIQTDAAINPGNSGGALVNTRGEVIGINTAIFSRSGGYQGIGFAIPSTMAHEVLNDLLQNGRVVRGYAGLAVQPLTPDLARAFQLQDTRGAVVTDVDPEGPVARAGLKRGDVIVAVGSRAVASDEELRTQMSRLRPGDQVSLGVVRNGRKATVEVTLVEPPQAPQQRRPQPQQRRRG
jgi:Do/DeqQ family serine protease